MRFLHSEKVHKIRSIGQNRSRYSLFRVLTSSYHSVNMPGFQIFFTGSGNAVKDRQGDSRMNSPSLSETGSIRVAGYLTELPPREVLAQKLKSAVAIARERLAARTAGKAETVQKGEMHITGKDD